MKDLGAGRMIFMSGSSMDLVTPIQKLQFWAINSLLLATDIEEGVGQRFVRATDFSPPMEIPAITKTNLKKAQEDTETIGAITAQAAMAICGNWVLAPMVSGNNDPNHPVINIGAFGETTVSVIQLAKALIWGPQQYLVLATAHKFSKCREYGY